MLFHDEKNDLLYTKTFRGRWDTNRSFPRDQAFIWRSIVSKRLGFCRLEDTEYRGYIPASDRSWSAPFWKAKTVGAIVIADKEGDEEFFSHDTKLLMLLRLRQAFP